MRTGFLPSLLLTFLLGASGAVNAAPAAQAAQPAAPASQAAPATKTGKINLNTADAETIQRELSGIGEAKAQAIVAYREANGPFSSVDELLEVKGIGKAILDKNRDQLAIN
ncbi:ComEA family DNA-binding protein [Pseudomonas gingeri]|uniref:Helix-hairpin-helix domain-containing protein n=1 Tax=Pseudomonas gingeri TaxID=117681 RepID=A0A7Y8CK03_9PSED|nr:ComEA family DNA-binding protein [Pseudomonas gingeri]NWB26341.1 helix-hairpin-helix domain-containing protein [Pseudomonas gingeri]NWC33918.1 helix-hairpin-helix domain-containing protein [Pseudomonas gingeri]NWD06231.1 helix-hairpin-helix domain-containing protein [Pseudomonas gingeri]NWD48154.1 helix-hairpin-helix domain-containing protein [Pseudomonas gingeri]NWE32240.1 helix-hairpin-helix domain-containing protein [Pseudomonas gingeri]